MTYIVRLPEANPIKFVQKGENSPDKWFRYSRPNFELNVEYLQKWQQGDKLRFQFDVHAAYIDSNAITCKMYECNTDTLIDVFGADMAWINGDYVNITVSLDLPDITGNYYVELTCPYWSSFTGVSPEVFWSEPISIKKYHENTILIEYRDTGINKDMFFINQVGNTFSFYKRIVGGVLADGCQPESIDTIYASQMHNSTQLFGVPYNVYTFTFGDGFGLPYYEVDLLNRIFCMDYFYFDGVRYSKGDGSKLAGEYIKGYPTSIWTIALEKADNTGLISYVMAESSPDDTEVESGTLSYTAFHSGLITLTHAEISAANLLSVVITSPTNSNFHTQILNVTRVDDLHSIVNTNLEPGNYSYHVIHF